MRSSKRTNVAYEGREMGFWFLPGLGLMLLVLGFLLKL
jgi:hypothetical protein